MPLSRVLGYYGLLLLLCSVVFARWLPPAAPDPAQADLSVQSSMRFHGASSPFASLEPAPVIVLPGKS